MRKVFLIYPCGKKIELKVPISIVLNGEIKTVLPTSPSFFLEAKKRYQHGNIKVEEIDIEEQIPSYGISKFVSLARKIKV